MEPTLTLVERVLFLKNVEVLSSMPTEPLAHLASRCEELHVDPGEVIFREGDTAGGVFVVVEGAVESRQGDSVLRVSGEGMVFGQLALTDAEEFSVTATARTHTHLLRVARDVVFEAVLDYPDVGLALVRTLARAIQGFIKRLVTLEREVAQLQSRLEGGGRGGPETPPER